jgi:hypothetical protein
MESLYQFDVTLVANVTRNVRNALSEEAAAATNASFYYG